MKYIMIVLMCISISSCSSETSVQADEQSLAQADVAEQPSDTPMNESSSHRSEYVTDSYPPMPTDPAVYPALLLYPDHEDIEQTIMDDGRERVTTFHSSASVEEVAAWYDQSLVANGWLKLLDTSPPAYKYPMTVVHYFIVDVDVQPTDQGSVVVLSQGLPYVFSPMYWPADKL